MRRREVFEALVGVMRSELEDEVYVVAQTVAKTLTAQREVERYCVMIGQACSYKIGHAAWLRARAKAKEIAGDRFDLKAFHDVLDYGAMPLSMLERIVEERARAMV